MLETPDETLNPVAEKPKREPGPPPLPINADEDDEDEATAQMHAEMFEQYEESMRSIGEGEIVQGTVLTVDDKGR